MARYHRYHYFGMKDEVESQESLAGASQLTRFFNRVYANDVSADTPNRGARDAGCNYRDRRRRRDIAPAAAGRRPRRRAVASSGSPPAQPQQLSAGRTAASLPRQSAGRRQVSSGCCEGNTVHPVNSWQLPGVHQVSVLLGTDKEATGHSEGCIRK